MAMKGLIGFLGVLFILTSCQEGENASDFTGAETTYALQQGSEYMVYGTATFKERRDGTTTILVALTGTDGNGKLPVHVHLGEIGRPAAEVAALLNPVTATTGISETTISKLADDSAVSYRDLIKLAACIKIHLSDTGAGRDVILAAGNIGTATSASSSRSGIGICKSE
jgi:hypothetical protein